MFGSKLINQFSFKNKYMANLIKKTGSKYFKRYDQNRLVIILPESLNFY